MEHVILIGEDNPHSSDPRYALFDSPPGCAGDRLRRHVLGVTRRTYLRDLRRVNLCGRRWSIVEARASAVRILSETPRDGVIVLLGRKVADAFGQGRIAAFSRVDLLGRALILLPHPSGRCRDWNEPDAFARARSVLAEAAPGVPWGEVDG